MVNTRYGKFTATLEKTAKNPRYSLIISWHTHCQKDSERNEGIEKGVQSEMKKGLVAIFCLLALTFTALPASAQTRSRRYDNRRYEQRYEQRTGDWRYQDRVYNGRNWDGDRWGRDRSFWDQHRDKLTTGIGAGAGALLGSAIGGTKGAIIGAIVGGGGAAAYTYGIRDKDR